MLVALIAALALYLRWQASLKPSPYDVMFEVRESETVRVKRETGGWRVIASNGANPVRLRTGIDPHALDMQHDLSPIDTGYRAAADLHPHKRYFFEIELEDRKSVV